MRQGTEALGLVGLAITMQQPWAGDRDFAEDRPQGKIVMSLAVPRLRKKAGGANGEVAVPAYDAMQDRAGTVSDVGDPAGRLIDTALWGRDPADG